jgi:predicted HTH domain antitoxin
MSVISLRLKDRELKRINELSRMVHKDKSTIARELIEYGWEFLMIKLYREGKTSLGTLSSKLELSVSETIDLLAEFGVESPIDYEDYLKGFDVFSVCP